MLNHQSPAAHRTGAELGWALDPQVSHLNHGSFGAVPLAAAAEQTRLRKQMESNPVRWFASQPALVAAARSELAALLGVDQGRLAFVFNASAGATVVYRSLRGSGPTNVMVTNHGYGAVTMGAAQLAARTGGRLTTVRLPLSATADEVVSIIASDLDRHRPDLLVIDQITSTSARAFPVDNLCRLARERGVRTLVDGAHAPAMLADPVCREADYWVGNLHKFACAPRGAAVLVSRGAGQELFGPIDSWGAELAFPERLDHVGTMDITAWLVAPFTWKLLDRLLGWAAIRAEASQLLDAACELVGTALAQMVDDPVPDVGQPVGPLRLLRLPDGLGDTRETADALRVPFNDAARIAAGFTSFGGRGYLRLSAHAYNAISDYERLAAVGIPLLRQWSNARPGPPASEKHLPRGGT